MPLNGITLTWATPFDAAELGARMEAYVETKALVHVFKLCVQHAQSEAPLGRLSPELIEMIATEVHDAAFNKQLKMWHKDLFCCANVCRPSEHLSAEKCKSLRESYQMELGSEHEDDSGCDSECGCAHHFDDYLAELGMGHDEHIDAVETLLAKVENNSYVESSGSFAKCRKIIAEDFGLEAYFTVFRDFEVIGTWVYPPATTIFAYLILPATHSALRTSSDHETVSYLSSAIVDPSVLHSEHHDLFKVAMCTLQLKPWPLSQQFTSVVPTSEPLPDDHGHNWYCSKHRHSRDAAARKEAYTSCWIRLTPIEAAASSAWPKLMILGSGCSIIEDDD